MLLDFFDVLLHSIYTHGLFYRIWFLGKFLKKRAPKHLTNSESPTDKASKQTFATFDSTVQRIVNCKV